MDKASKKALKKTSPPFQCRTKGGFMSINRCRMVSAFMGQIRGVGVFCLCVVALDGQIELDGWLGRLMQPFIKL